MALAAFVFDKMYSTDGTTISSGVTDNTICFANQDGDVRPSDLEGPSSALYVLPVPQVVGNYVYSYENNVRMRCVTAPNVSVSNIKVIGPNTAPGSGLVVYLGTYSGGFTPSNSISTKATGIQHTQYFDFGAGSYLSWPVMSGTTITGIGQTTIGLVSQLRIDATASGNTGYMSYYTLSVAYDEV